MRKKTTTCYIREDQKDNLKRLSDLTKVSVAEYMRQGIELALAKHRLEGQTMPNPDLTEIVCIVDRSGSMESIRGDAIGGFNTFLEDQKKQPGYALLTYAQFDDVYEVVHDGVDIQKVEPLTNETFVPRGSTALLDAIGKTINVVGERLAKAQEGDRPGKVVVVILTDGQENASKEFDREAILKLITRQQKEWQWEFVFLGANQDAISAGRGIGIHHATNFTADADGVQGVYKGVSQAISSYRTTGLGSDLKVPDSGSDKGSSSGRIN